MAQAVLEQKRAVSPAADTGAAGRMVFLDNLRTVLIAGIIVAHAATHYIGGGAWIGHQELAGKILVVILGAAGLLGGLFWVGLFFLIAGYLAHRSLEHHGAGQFLRERVVRLGIPFLIFLVGVMPLMDYWLYRISLRHGAVGESFLAYVTPRWLEMGAGPLWFVADLLFFSAVYAAWWKLVPHPRPTFGSLPARILPLLAVAIALPTFFIHFDLPLNTHQYWDLHFSQWPQYILLFWFGAYWDGRGWTLAVPGKTWVRCGIVTLATAAVLTVTAIAGGVLGGDSSQFTGGSHWQALVVACGEGVLAVCGSLWVLEFFRRRADRQSVAVQQICRSAYGAYVVHYPLVSVFALWLVPLNLPFEVNFLLIAPMTLIVSFGIAWVAVVRLHLLPQIL